MNRKIGLYIRTATQENRIGVTIQRKKLLSFLALKLQVNPQFGEIVDEYVDEGVSGKKRDRPALNQLLEDIRQGHVDTILVQDQARFSRGISHFLSMIEQLQNCKVEILYLNDLTLNLPLERTKNNNDFLGDAFERFGIQKNKEQTRTNAGTIVASSGS